MNTIKGFAAIDALVDNTEGIVSPFGELSDLAASYAREKGVHADSVTYPGIRIHSFLAIDNDDDSHIALSPSVEGTLLSVADYIRAQYQAGNIPLNASKAAFITTLEGVPAFSAIADWEIGELIAGPSAPYNMPDYVAFTFTDTGEDYTVRLWFADASFIAQYDEYEIIVVPPTTPIDNLNAETAMVAPILAAFTASAAVTALTVAIGGHPPTKSKIQTYVWHDPITPLSTLTAQFGLVIYGGAGDTTDRIKDAIKAYIAANSAETNWPDIFPDLYAENEFVLMPRWDKEADAGSILTYPIYSPIEKVSQSILDATDLIPSEYAASVTIATYLNLNLESAATYFRSLTMLVVGSPLNSGGIFKLSQRFPDYTALAPSTSDFNRMAAPTRDFILKLAEALEIARLMTPSSTVDVGFSREVRDGHHFVSFEVAGDPYTYLVMSKHSYDEVIV